MVCFYFDSSIKYFCTGARTFHLFIRKPHDAAYVTKPLVELMVWTTGTEWVSLSVEQEQGGSAAGSGLHRQQGESAFMPLWCCCSPTQPSFCVFHQDFSVSFPGFYSISLPVPGWSLPLSQDFYWVRKSHLCWTLHWNYIICLSDFWFSFLFKPSVIFRIDNSNFCKFLRIYFTPKLPCVPFIYWTTAHFKAPQDKYDI